MVILWNIKNILNRFKFLRLIIVVCFCFVTMQIVEAKTITDSSVFVETSRLDYFKDIYSRSKYKNYMLVPTYMTYGSYNGYNDYYLCLSNESVNYSDQLNATLNCDEMYRYYRNNDSYVLEKYNDNVLTATNSTFYSNSSYNNKFFISLLITILICLCISLFFDFFLNMFGGSL